MNDRHHPDRWSTRARIAAGVRRLGTSGTVLLMAAAVLVPAALGGSSAQAAAAPGLQYNDTLSAVSCPAVGTCMAVGTNTSADSVQSPVAEEWHDGSWQVFTVPGLLDLFGVSCASATYCVAVGGSDGQAASELWNGQTWQPLTTQNAGGPASLLYSVDCLSATDCMAVGYGWPNDDQENTLVERWNGHDWRLLRTPPHSYEVEQSLNAVSCLGTTWCMAVGEAFGPQRPRPLAVQWNGTRWLKVATPRTGSSLSGLSCTSPANCIAVGGYTNAAGRQMKTLGEQWNGTSWQVLTTMNPGSGNSLSSVSCPTAANCVAVGSGLAEQWNGSTWQALPAPSAGLVSVSCPAASSCLAVGGKSSRPDHLTLAESWNGTAWQDVSSPSPPEVNGYWILTANGGVANFDAPWYGSDRGHLSGRAIGIITDTATGGYWILN